jgi:hypothetical protein
MQLLYNRGDMHKSLSRLEARMEALIEGTFARMFAGRVHPRDVALQLARALEDSAAAGAPATRYTVHLHPADAQALLDAHPQLARLLATELLTLAREAHLTLPHPPEVVLLPEPEQRPRALVITYIGSAPSETSTQSLTPLQPVQAPALPRAFVILDGARTIPLQHSIVSLGRRFDNHIIVDDPRVSRAHAQLRLRFGHYVVYDLGSTGGTFVNGQRVDECVLRPGDVISLGGVTLIYGEDGPGTAPPRPSRAPEGHGTRPMPAPPATLPPKPTA